MPGFFQQHLRPLAGSAGLHLGLFALLGLAALRWTSSQPPVELAIEGYVVPESELERAAPKARSSAPPAARPAPPVAKPPEPVASPPVAPPVDAAVVEREQRQAEAQARERLAAERQQAQAAERARAEEVERRLNAEADAKRKAAEAERKREAEAAEAKREAEERAQAERDAAARAEREAQLQKSLAAEEEGAALARSGVVDEYRALLVQTIERNWIRQPTALAGLECTLYVTQAPGGTVVDVKLGTCNGDRAVRESITNAVFRSAPLPAPRDARLFERRLEIVFKPTE